MNYCSQCGSDQMAFRVPVDDNVSRNCCESCGHIFYFNPKIVVGTLPRYKGRILLCRRNIKPRLGHWTLPAGFMECEESVEDGARRETMEEAGVEVELRRLYCLYNVVSNSQVYLLFLADIPEPEAGGEPVFDFGHETSEVGLFRPKEIPWEELAFESIRFALRSYVADKHPDDGPVWSERYDGPPILEDQDSRQ